MEMKTPKASGTMVPTMAPDNAHKDIPGNPSTAASSRIKLNDRSSGKPLRAMNLKFSIFNSKPKICPILTPSMKTYVQRMIL